MEGEQLMTLEEFEKYPIGIIRSGIISNSPTGHFATRDDNLLLLRFVVKKRIEGWTVYFDTVNKAEWQILRVGNRAIDELAHRRAFPCTDEVYKLYCR